MQLFSVLAFVLLTRVIAVPCVSAGGGCVYTPCGHAELKGVETEEVCVSV